MLRNASNLKQADDKYKYCYIRRDLNQDKRKVKTKLFLNVSEKSGNFKIGQGIWNLT